MLSAGGHVEIVQCKQWRGAHVGRGELIEFDRAIRRNHAVLGHFWAPYGFSKPAVQYARTAGIVLYNNEGIRNLLDRVLDSEAAALALQREVDISASDARREVSDAAIIVKRKHLRRRMTPFQTFIILILSFLLCGLLCLGVLAATR
jgi:hypothetical protein